MGSEPSGNCGPVVVPCPGAVPLRSGAAPGDAGTRRWIQRQRWHRTKRQRPGPCGSRCPGPARSLQRAAAAGRGRGSAPSGNEGGSSPRSGSGPGTRREPAGPERESCSCERLPDAWGIPRAPPAPTELFSERGSKAGQGCCAGVGGAAATNGAVLKFISSSVLEAKAASLFRFRLSRWGTGLHWEKINHFPREISIAHCLYIACCTLLASWGRVSKAFHILWILSLH